jgi:hypothetical protein
MGSATAKRFEPYHAVILAALLYFAIRLIFFAVNLSPYVPPDESTHFGISRLFQQTWLIPADTNESWAYGQITHRPFLYYWLMGRFLHLNIFGISDLLFLRLVNAAIALVTVFLGLQWIRLVTPNRATQALFVILLTNTPMYTFVGASVSYDNLTILWAVCALYYLMRLQKNPCFDDLFVFVLILLAGALSKKTFLPLAPLFLILGVFHITPKLYTNKIDRQLILRVPHGWQVIWSALIIVLLIFNLRLYGGNLINYGCLIPTHDQVLTLEQAMQNRIFARNHIIRSFKADQLSYTKALQMAARIGHPGDRRATVYLIERIRQHKTKPERLMGPGKYALVWWQKMLQGLMGIVGHRTMTKPLSIMAIYQAVFFTALLLLLVLWVKDSGRTGLANAAVIFLFYAIILMFFINYPTYRQYYSLLLKLQGRYLLPVIVPLYGLVACSYMEAIKTNWLKAVVLCLLASFFVWGDFVYFLQNVDASWYGRPLF